MVPHFLFEKSLDELQKIGMASSRESHLMTLYVTWFHAERSPGDIDMSHINDEEINNNHRNIFHWFPSIGMKQFNIG